MIFYFSGCGNTALMASHLGEILHEPLIRIDANTPMEFNATAQKRIIWAFPIYSWGVPRELKRFIGSVKILGAETINHFMVATCGDDAGVADRVWENLIRARRWKPQAAHTVIMPNTYVCLPGFDTDSEQLTAEKLAKAPERIAQVAHAIKCNSNISQITRGHLAWVKTHVIYPMFMRFLTSPKPFRASDECNGCGLCSRTCPNSNITILNGRPQWDTKCALCLSCYHRCPQKAINYGKSTLGKGHYFAPKKF